MNADESDAVCSNGMNTTFPPPPEQLCALVDEHFATLVVFARQWTQSGAEDLVQDAFLQLVKRLPFEGWPEQPVAWLFRVVRNAAIDRHRKKKCREEHEERAAEEKIWFIVPTDRMDKTEEVEKMLHVLTAQQREIVVARIWGGLTFDEIAAMTGLSRTSVFRQYGDALNLMREKYN